VPAAAAKSDVFLAETERQTRRRDRQQDRPCPAVGCMHEAVGGKRTAAVVT
jgi:hypothetical protein